LLTFTPDVGQGLRERLTNNRYLLHQRTDEEPWLPWLVAHQQQVDCLITEVHGRLEPALQELKNHCLLMPTVVVTPSPDSPSLDWGDLYHSAVLELAGPKLTRLETSIDRAIQQFVALPIASDLAEPIDSAANLPAAEALAVQKERLTDKLKARLGYLGVYYKRSPENFFRNMNKTDRKKCLRQLANRYRAIILMYFSKEADSTQLNSKIDELVNEAFFADISVAQIVEVHMDLMDEFSKQLLLEGRSDEILLDYRLTLIDVIAHLCEMYRRSIPREE